MATDVFIRFKSSQGTAVEGESKDTKFANWSEILGWSCGATQSTTLSSQSTGFGGGKVGLHAFNFSKFYDAATNDLLKNMFAGEHYKSVEVVMREAGGGDPPQKPFLCIVMQEVFVMSYQLSGSSDKPIEQWSLAYGKIAYHYTKQKQGDQRGAVEGFKSTGWDQFANLPWDNPDKPSELG